ncbi:hypothetical protein [Streptomyces sp. NPDC052042]|uniref:hypothetical protein n=1 Tax=Streptomyces sp. NPDC052042 TaxID=3365683 RepID=UPI0037D1EA33
MFIAVFAVAAFGMSAPQQHRLIGLNPPLAAVLVSLHSSILYLASALAGALGGLGISMVGSGSLGLLAAALAVLALLHGAAAPVHDPRCASNTGSRMPDRCFRSGLMEEFTDRLPHPVVRNAGRTGARDRPSPPGGQAVRWAQR